MPKLFRHLLFILPLLTLLVLGTITAALWNRGNADAIPAPITKDLGPVLPFTVDGFSDHDLRGNQPVLLTFFASWCAPCILEHLTLMKLAPKIPIDGIDFMDQPDDLKNFLSRDGNPFQKIGQDVDGNSGVAFGVTGLPTSFIIAHGHILYRHDGPLTEADMPTVLSLMRGKN